MVLVKVVAELAYAAVVVAAKDVAEFVSAVVVVVVEIVSTVAEPASTVVKGSFYQLLSTLIHTVIITSKLNHC